MVWLKADPAWGTLRDGNGFYTYFLSTWGKGRLTCGIEGNSLLFKRKERALSRTFDDGMGVETKTSFELFHFTDQKGGNEAFTVLSSRKEEKRFGQLKVLHNASIRALRGVPWTGT